MTAHMTGQVEHFPLLPNNGSVTLLTRFFAVSVVLAGWAILALFVAGVLSQGTAISLGVLFLVFPPAFVWGIRRSQQGAAELHPEQLLVRTRAVTHSYPWGHIANIEVITIRQTGALSSGLYGLFGINLNQRLVRLRLCKWLRQGLFRSRLGTDVFGIPAPGIKVVQLFLEDPEAFARAAAAYLQATGAHTS